MNAPVRTSPPAVRSSSARLVWIAFGYVVIAALLAVSSVLRGSLSGELNPNSPSDTEIATWEWGQATFLVGGALLIIWSVAIALLRRRFGLTPTAVAGLIIVGFAICMTATAVAWIIALPPLPTA